MAVEGTFVLADIGGYTQFLSGVGLEHAKEITSHLFNSLLKCNRGRWKLANIEGDCIFFYGPGREPVDELIDHVRALYEDFCDGVMDIASRSNCPCGACSRTSDLKLKFVVHAGEFDTQKIGPRTELIGQDIIVAHRLLKNRVPLREYLLLTKGYTAQGALNSSLPRLEGRERYEDVGEIEYVCLDLAPLREQHAELRQFFLTEADALLSVTTEIDAPLDVVWGAMMDLDKVNQWAVTLTQLDHIQGETGRLGEVYRCVHTGGSEAVHLTVGVDEAGHRKTERLWDKTWMSRLTSDMYMTTGAEALPGGTTRAYLYIRWRPGMPVVSQLFRPLSPLLVGVMKRQLRKDMDGLKAFCEGQAAQDTRTEGKAGEG